MFAAKLKVFAFLASLSFLPLCVCVCAWATQVSADEVCGCPLVADVFQETKGFCRVAKRKCTKHYNWEKLRRAEIDLERVRWVRLLTQRP